MVHDKLPKHTGHSSSDILALLLFSTLIFSTHVLHPRHIGKHPSIASVRGNVNVPILSSCFGLKPSGKRVSRDLCDDMVSVSAVRVFVLAYTEHTRPRSPPPTHSRNHVYCNCMVSLRPSRKSFASSPHTTTMVVTVFPCSHGSSGPLASPSRVEQRQWSVRGVKEALTLSNLCPSEKNHGYREQDTPPKPSCPLVRPLRWVTYEPCLLVASSRGPHMTHTQCPTMSMFLPSGSDEPVRPS